MSAKKDRPSRDILSVLEEELNRIVLDVHDGPVQSLFAALSLLAQIQHDLKSDSPDLNRLDSGVNQVSSMIEAALHEIKFFLGTFRSPGFKERPLDKVIRSLIIQHEDWTGQTIELEVEELPQDVTLPVKIALYRIVQEALSNGSRHSGSDYQYVKLWTEGDTICLKVADDGKGFIPTDLQMGDLETHIGLRGMRERVALVDGTFKLNSEIGKGTSIEVRVPSHV